MMNLQAVLTKYLHVLIVTAVFYYPLFSQANPTENSPLVDKVELHYASPSSPLLIPLPVIDSALSYCGAACEDGDSGWSVHLTSGVSKGSYDVRSVLDEPYFYFRPGDKELGRVTFVLEHTILNSRYKIIDVQRVSDSGNKPRLISEAQTPPDTSQYTIMDDEAVGQQFFNGQNRTIYRRVIAGIDFVIEKGADNGVYEWLNAGKDDTRELLIFANHLTISSKLLLHRTNIKISAKSLVFSGKGQLVTTAKSQPAQTTVGQNGSSGEASGNVSLALDRIDFQDVAGTPQHRIVTSGVKGQKAGPGKPGTNGTSMPGTRLVDSGNWRKLQECSGGLDVHYVYINDKHGDGDFGAKTFPGNGGNATGAGVSGNGGHAGNLIVSGLDATDFASLNSRWSGVGGKGGDNWGITKGGNPGTPRYSVHVQRPKHKGSGRWFKLHMPERQSIIGQGHHTVDIPVEITEIKALSNKLRHPRGCARPAHNWAVMTTPGADAQAPTPSQSGQKGELEKGDWTQGRPPTVSLPLLELIDEYVQDTFLAGQTRLARDVAWFYLNSIEQAQLKGVDHIKSTLWRVVSEIESGRDYFGSPMGWVPRQSATFSLAAYENILPASLDTLWLTRVLLKTWEKSEAKSEHLNKLEALLEAEIVQLDERLASLASELPKAETILVERRNAEELQNQLVETRQRSLEDRAKAELEDAQAMDPLDQVIAVASVIPASAPYAAAAGTIKASVDRNSGSPITAATMADIASTYQLVSEIDYSASKARVTSGSHDATFVPTLTLPTTQNATPLDDLADEINEELKTIEKDNRDLLQEIGSTYKLFKEVERVTQQPPPVPRIEVENLANQYAGSDGTLKKLLGDQANAVDATLSANVTLEALRSELSATLARRAESLNDLARVQKAHAEEAELSDWLLKSTVKGMARRAEDRIRLLKYYFAKSFEHTLLVPAPLDFTKTKTASKIQSLIEQGNTSLSHDFARRSAATVFSDELADVKVEVAKLLNNGYLNDLKQLTKPVKLTAAELEMLNDGVPVYLSPQRLRLFITAATHRELYGRILSVKVRDIKLQNGSVAPSFLTAEFDDQASIETPEGFYYFNYSVPNRIVNSAEVQFAVNPGQDDPITDLSHSTRIDPLIDRLLGIESNTKLLDMMGKRAGQTGLTLKYFVQDPESGDPLPEIKELVLLFNREFALYQR